MISSAFLRQPRLWFFASLFCAVLPLCAAPSFRSDKNYPSLGLRIRTLGGSTPEPLPQHKTYTYTFTSGDESVKRDLFDPHELWYATQHAGQWRDEDGNVLILGHATHLFPAIQSELQHVSREDFDRALAEPASLFDPASPEALAAWVKAFASCTPQKPELLRTGFNLTHAQFFPVDESSLLVYAFRAKTRMPNGQTAPSDWFCAVVKIGDNTLKSKVRKDFETQFLASVAAIPQTGMTPTTGIRSKTLSTAAANGKTPALEIPDHPSRAAARKSIANMKDWWYAETPEYIFLSDIRSATGKALVKELQTTMPALRSAFAQLIPPFDPTTDVSVIRIYEEREAYQQYVGEAHDWSIGLWTPMRRELVILSQGKDREQTLEIIRHEGFHQYLFYATGMAENAMWFNEGHACFFEAAEIGSKGRVEIPEDNRVNHLLDNLETAANLLPKIINADRSAFYGGSNQQRSLNYTTAWALIYFLRKGAPAEGLSAYEGILDTYLKTLAATKDCQAATSTAFEKVNMSRLKEHFTDFWKKGRNSARRYDPLAAQKPSSRLQK